MSAETYFDAADAVLRRIRETQTPAIRQAAVAVAECLATRHIWHLLDQGHTRDEFVGRTGGMIALHPILINLDVHHQQPLPKTRTGQPTQFDYVAYRKGDVPIDYILDQAMLRPGDVLLIHSVSGSRGMPIGMAIAARQRGAIVIAITSLTYSRSLEPVHPSGKRLCEAADLVIDDCGPVGDTLVTIPGMEEGVCASSGLAFVYIMWALEAEVMGLLAQRGVAPRVYRNANLPGAQQVNERITREYDQTGV